VLIDNASGIGAPTATQCLAVAYSGGRDSTALLHATAQAAARLPGAQVVALHVHHGLSERADDWLDHAQVQCAAWAAAGWPVRLVCSRLALQPARGESLEAVARVARYRALAEMAHEVGAERILLAHHRRDQAETFLLQALRGAGVAGLSAMPVVRERHGVQWVRPWLHHPREAVEAYVAHHGLSFVDDDSNGDARFARNRLRLKVWPALSGAFAQAEASLAQAGARAADARSCLRLWLDQAVAGVALGERELDAHALLALGPPQQREVLRHWFTAQTGCHMPASTVSRLTQELPVLVNTGRSIEWRSGAFDLGLYRGVLSWRTAVASHQSPAPQTLSIDAPGLYAVPAWAGSFMVRIVSEGKVVEDEANSVPLALLGQALVRARVGGETFQLGPRRPARSLRKQYQAQGVPQWEREGPLLCVGEQLVFARGLGVDARCRLALEDAAAASAGPHVALSWVEDPPI